MRKEKCRNKVKNKKWERMSNKEKEKITKT